MFKLGTLALKSRCQQGCIPSGISWEESISLPFPAFRGILYSLACDLSLHLQMFIILTSTLGIKSLLYDLDTLDSLL